MKGSFSLTRANLSQQVADHLEQLILTSPSMENVEKLPSEQQLASEYNVSRPVIREALKLLQERGLVSLKNGIGAFITKPEAQNVLAPISRIMQMNNISDDDLTDIRGILEVYAAAKAAENGTAEDFKALEANYQAFTDTHLSLRERVALDREFHILVAKASGNALLEMFSEVLTSLLDAYMGKGVLIEGGVDDAILRHRRIIDAIISRNSAEAEKAMQEHVLASLANVERFAKRDKTHLK